MYWTNATCSRGAAAIRDDADPGDRAGGPSAGSDVITLLRSGPVHPDRDLRLDADRALPARNPLAASTDVDDATPGTPAEPCVKYLLFTLALAPEAVYPMFVGKWFASNRSGVDNRQ